MQTKKNAESEVFEFVCVCSSGVSLFCFVSHLNCKLNTLLTIVFPELHDM